MGERAGTACFSWAETKKTETPAALQPPGSGEPIPKRADWSAPTPLGGRRQGRFLGPYLSSESTPCWLWFAWASIAVEAWLRICALARFAVSEEKSAS